MSDLTEGGYKDAFVPESLHSSNRNSGMNILQANPASKELPSTLELPEELIQESENSKPMVQLTTLGLHSNAVENDIANGNYHQIYTTYNNYQKCESNNYFTVDLTINNHSVNKGAQILDQNTQEFEGIVDPIIEASEEHRGNLFKQKSWQELKQQDEIKNLALIPSQSDNLTSQTDKSNNPSEEQRKKEIVFKQKSWQELCQQDENKNLALNPNSSVYSIPQTGKIYDPSSLTISTSKEIQSQTENIQSQTEIIQSQTDIIQSQTDIIQSQTEIIPSQTEMIPSQTEMIPSQTEMIPSQTEITQSHQILAPANVDAPMLTYLLVKINESESKAEESLIFLDCIKRIEKWFAKLNELNQYNTIRFQALLEKIIDFQRLESLVKEKLEMITIGKDLSLSELQSEEGLNFETSTYRSFNVQCERVLRLLKFYERYLMVTYERHRKLRTKYLECSLQIAMYPIEVKLFEDRKKTMNILNQSSFLMNKISLKLEETDNFTDNLSFECIFQVNNFFRDCEVMFSQ